MLGVLALRRSQRFDGKLLLVKRQAAIWRTIIEPEIALIGKELLSKIEQL
jgi:hypothetical protein